MAEIDLYGTHLSGHVHRVKLLLGMLQIQYRFVEAPADVRRSPDFLQLNPLGEIPVLKDSAIVLTDSNAILVYLAKRYAAGSPWLPEEPVAASRVQRWLSIAAGEVRYGPAKARIATLWGSPADRGQADDIASRLLPFMESHLKDRLYLAVEHPTIADLACYSYIAHAPEGGISLEPYAAIGRWLSRIESLPRFQPMPRSTRPPTPARAG